MEKKKTIVVIAVVLVGLAILFLTPLRGLAPMSWIIKLLYRQPLGICTLLAGTMWLIRLYRKNYSYRNNYDGDKVTLFMAWGVIVISLLWSAFSGPFAMYGLYRETEYEKIQDLIPITEMRAASYAEAYQNIDKQKPNAQFGFGDLDYVQGHWIADFSPRAGITPLTEKTAGFFIFTPENQGDRVVVERQEMPYAEGGILWNSDKFWINSKFPTATYRDILYIKDPETQGYMAVTSLIYRKGVFRVPYVKHVLIIHGNGEYELLSTVEAEQDPRLEGIQIMPEWLAALKAEAYGWREGPFSTIFTRKNRVQVQESTINKENSAPYLLQTEQGMFWYSPFAPYKQESLKGIAIENAESLNSPVLIWELPEDQAYSGVDALATTIKGGYTSINWLKVSENSEGNVRTGDTDVIELIPCPKEVDGQVDLFYCGYVATDPPQITRFFTIVNARTGEVYQDAHNISIVNSWLKSEIEIPPLKTQTIAECSNVSEMTDIQLLECIELFTEELKKRK